MSTQPFSDSSQPAHTNQHLQLRVFRQLFHEIAQFSPLLTATSLSYSHESLRPLLGKHLTQNLHDMLSRYFSRPRIEAFRSLLRETRAVLSGSCALHFAMRDEHWEPTDLDIYTPFGTGFVVVNWLIRQEGYAMTSSGLETFVRRPKPVTGRVDGPFDWTSPLDLETLWSAKDRPRLGYAPRAVHVQPTEGFIYRVYKLKKPSSTCSIDVIESSTPSFLSPITRFHSSLLMNYISADALCILYPSLTLKRLGILQLQNRHFSAYEEAEEDTAKQDSPVELLNGLNVAITAKMQRAIDKYQGRRFTLYASPVDLGRACGSVCPALVREDRDRWTLSIDFSRHPPSHDNLTGSANTLQSPADSSPDAPSSAREGVHFTPESQPHRNAATKFQFNATGRHPRHEYDTPLRPPLRRTRWTLSSITPRSVTRPAAQKSFRWRSKCSNPYCHHAYQGRAVFAFDQAWNDIQEQLGLLLDDD